MLEALYLTDWLLGALVALAVWLGLIIMRKALMLSFQKVSGHFKLRPGEYALLVLGRTRLWFLLAVGLVVGAQFVGLLEPHQELIRKAFILSFLVQVWIWARESIEFIVSQLSVSDAAGAKAAVPAIQFLGRLVVLSLIFLLALDNLGFNVTALVAGLGVGGIAVALALQNILGDLFSSLSILLDKPFQVGDFVIVGELAGTVERIGLKSTRIQALTGEQLVFANSDLLASRIRNFKQLKKRRITFRFGVTYQTPVKLMKQIPGMIREIVDPIENAELDRVHFNEFGDFSLVFEVVYYVAVPEFPAYMAIQQEMNLAMMERFEKEGIEFAYPTQTLFVKSEAQANQSNPLSSN